MTEEENPIPLPHCSTKQHSVFGWFQTSCWRCFVSCRFLVGFCCVLVALRLLFLYWKWESVPWKKRKKNEQIKKKRRKGRRNPLYVLSGWMYFLLSRARVFWCTSVKCGACALAHAARLKSQYIFFLAPQSQHVKTSSRSAGLLPLSVLHTLSRTMRSDPHTAL